MTDEIKLERKGEVGSITLNRPRALNSLTQPMVVALQPMLEEWARDEQVRAVVIRGTAREDGSVPFCAGGDIKLLYEQRTDPERRFAVEFYEQEYRLNTYVHRYPKPYVALIDGVVMGGGVGVSVHGSHRVMSERALFAMPETGIGLFPDVGATYFLPRLKGRTGLFLGLTGARIGAADALDLGLATHVVPSARLQALDDMLTAAGLGDDAPGAIDGLLAEVAEPPGEGPLAPHHDAIDRCFGAASVEEIIARLEGEGSDWAAGVIKTLGEKSPRSLKVTFRQLTEYNDLSFEEAMRLEYRMAIRCNFNADFFEGIRAQVVDKDRQPKWQPPSLSDVTAAMVDAYFAAPGTGDITFG